MSEDKAKSTKRFWDIFGFIILGPLGSRYNSIFNLLADGDEKKEEEITYRAMKILHIIALSIVPIVFIADIVILLLKGNGYSSENINIQVLFVSYSVLPILILLGTFFSKIVNWRTWSKTSKIGIFFNHLTRLFCFFGIALTGLVGTANFNTFFCIIPIFIISATALIITFPTKKKWREWSDWTSQI